MTNPALPKQIQLLVDSLRKQDTTQLSLTDVASVTEVLIGTMSVFFKSIDTSIYRECRSLSDYISNARKEIASLQPGDLESARIPRAGLELDAIVQQTEEATNTIMEAAEEIMALDPDDKDNYVATSQDAVMRIFEACSFQDITGQRISKVVETLAHIETRVMELRDLLGVTEQDIEEAKEAAGPIPEDRSLLSGPALEGEGINQSEVDALMGTQAKAAETAAAPAPEPAPEPAPKPEPKPEPKVEAPKAVSPKQLDNMFEEDFDPVAEHEAKEAEKKAEEAKKAEEEKKKAEKKAEPAKEAKEEEIDLPEGEEVSQDDIDALFG
ncbi:protein phosphatase CheZ [Kordiimonas lipolytica]|uniref:Protein phosphatase CheZ n=1 Tax=Kordiimonas lipolytica TaxID=1662421 RepID=A0ABV8UDK8_9PROT|nr:protein phosphatase CheZ [Kordiimonas lipolytica]